jgi:hypothetical protein
MPSSSPPGAGSVKCVTTAGRQLRCRAVGWAWHAVLMAMTWFSVPSHCTTMHE